jgi:hypothetical protein
MLEAVGGGHGLTKQYENYSEYIKQRHAHHDPGVYAADVYENMMKGEIHVGFKGTAVVAKPRWTSHSDQWVKQYSTPDKERAELPASGEVCLCAQGKELRLVNYALIPQMPLDRECVLAVDLIVSGIHAAEEGNKYGIGFPFLKIVYKHDPRSKTYTLIEVVLNFTMQHYSPEWHFSPTLVDEEFHDYSPLVAELKPNKTSEFSAACTELVDRLGLTYFTVQTANRQLFTHGDNSEMVNYAAALYVLLAPAVVDYIRSQFPGHRESLHVLMEDPSVLKKLMIAAGARDVWRAIKSSRPSLKSLLTHTSGLEVVIELVDVLALFSPQPLANKIDAKNKVLAVLKHRTVAHAPGVHMSGLINTVLLAFIHPDWYVTKFVKDWAQRKNLPGATPSAAPIGTFSSLFMQPSWYTVNAGDRTEGDFYFPTVLPVCAITPDQTGIGYGGWITTEVEMRESYSYISNGIDFVIVIDLRRGLSAVAITHDISFLKNVVRCFRVLAPKHMPPLYIPPMCAVGEQHLSEVEALLEKSTFATSQIPALFYAMEHVCLFGEPIKSKLEFGPTAPAHRKRHFISVGDRRYNMVFDPNHIVPGQKEPGGWLALDPVTHGIAGSVVLSQFAVPQTKDKTIPLVSFQGRLYGPKSVRDKITAMTDPTSILYKERKQDGMASGKTSQAADFIDTLYTTHYTAPATRDKTVFNEIYEQPIRLQFIPETATPDMTWM